MSWNWRLLAHELDGDVFFQIHEVYYDEFGNPNGYTQNPVSVGSETVEGVKWVLDEMVACLGKPTLCAGDRFPEEWG